MQGWLPVRVAMRQGTTLHAVEAGSSSSTPTLYRSGGAGTWQASSVAQSNVTLASASVAVEPANAPDFVVNDTAGAAHVAHLDAMGTWSSDLVSPTLNGSVGVDATGRVTFAQCSSTTVTTRSKVGGAWGPVVTAYTRPSGFDSMSCGEVTVSPSGVVAFAVVRSYWAGAPLYATRYDLGVLHNESGTFTYENIASNLTSWGGDLRFDGANAMHLFTGTDYRVRPASGSFAVETLPAGYQLPASGQRVTGIDRTGALNLVWTTGYTSSTTLWVARRTGPSTWAVDGTPALASMDTGLTATVAPQGLVFDATNRAHLLTFDGSTYRSVVK